MKKKSLMQVVGQTGSETVFEPKQKSSPLS